MKLTRSRLFAFTPVLVAVAAFDACATIEEPTNSDLEALRVEREAASGTPESPTASSSVGPSVGPGNIITPVGTPGGTPTGMGTDTPAPTEPQGSVPPASSLPPATPVPGPPSTPSDTSVAPSPSVPAPDPTQTGSTPTPVNPAPAPAPSGSPAPAPSAPTTAAPAPVDPIPLADGGVALPNCGEELGTLAPAVADATKVSVQYVTYDMNATGQVSFHVRLSNQGTMNVSLKNITVRYWFTSDDVTYTIMLDSVQAGVKGAKVTSETTPDGHEYLLVTYPDTSLMFGADANTTDIGIRLAPGQNNNNMQFDQSDDWSWAPKVSAWGNNPKLTVYRNDPNGKPALLSGTPPCAMAQ
ncbi:MAG TPA: cellulose binding domain-containing protein [Polyangiaceae bacterium]|jgi:hypothetical protein|nr:cellulose binding domain-containing protein [Polyangiaceae bacterium]